MIKIDKLNPFGKLCVSMGMIPSSYSECLTYEEQLLWFCNFLEKVVIPAVNTEGEAIEELQSLYIELKEYVDNYFENLNVQEEINNKLDDMAESGELADIIAQYLELAGMLVYNTLADLKAAENLDNGSSVMTLGYYEVGDGGSAKYKVREVINTDVANDKNIIALTDNNLVAEIILDKTINVKQFGAYGDNTHDDTLAITDSIDYIGDNGIVLLPEGNYKISNKILINNGMTFKGLGNATITVSDDYVELFPDKDECIIGNKNRTLTTYNVKNITIENIKVINHVANTGHLGIIELNGTDNCTIKNCTIDFDNGTDTVHSWGIILLGANRNTLIDHVNIKDTSTEGSLGGCLWIRGAYPEGNTPSLNINVTNSYFESSAVDEITCIDDGLNGCITEANITNCTIIGTASTTLPNFLASIITVGSDSYVTGRYSNCIIKGKCAQYGVELGESGYSDTEKVIASIDNSTIDISSGKGIISRNKHFTVSNCTVKVPTGNQAINNATVVNCNILGQLNSCDVDNCYIKNSGSYACETCKKVTNSIIECTAQGGIHFFGNTKQAIISNNLIKADTYGIYAQAYNSLSVDKCCITNNVIERLNNTSNSGSIGIYIPTMTGASLVAGNIISGTVGNTATTSYGYNYTVNINASITTANNVEYRY